MAETSGRPDVIVVGAGIAGLSIAWHLLLRGSSVQVVERTSVAAGASGVQPGGVRQQWSTRVNCLLARESVAFYHDVEAHLEARTRLVFDPCGYLFVADGPDTLAGLEANVRLQNEAGVPSRLLSTAEAAALVPGLRTDGMAGAAFCAEDGYFDRPQTVVEAFGAAVERLGGTILIGTVERVERARDWYVGLNDGRRLGAGQIVLAAGVDTRFLAAPFGGDLPIAPERRWIFYSDEIRERLVEPLVVAPERHFAAKQLANGRVLTSDLRAAGDDESGRGGWLATVRAGIRSLLPILEYVSLPILVDGLYDVTPDHQPILDQVSDGLWVAAGFSGHGFMLAPAVGRLLSEALAGTRDPVLDHFAHARFAGSELARETQIV